MRGINKDTSAKLTTGSINSIIITIVIIVVLFKAYALLIPEAQTAGDEMNASARCNTVGCFWNQTDGVDCQINSSPEGNATGCTQSAQTIPLAGLFSGNGVIFLLIMAMLTIVIIRSLMQKKK